MKLRLTAGAVLAATAIALPAVTHAATYEPFTQTDPAYNADTDPDEPVNPTVDIVQARGFRSEGQISVVTKYADFGRASYSRRLVTLVDPATDKGRIVEYRTGAPGKAPVTSFYTYDRSTTAVSLTSCVGVRAVADVARDKLTIVIPTSCYPGSRSVGAYVRGTTGKWTAQTWSPGPLDGRDVGVPSQSDEILAEWQWTPGAPTRLAPRGHEPGLF